MKLKMHIASPRNTVLKKIASTPLLLSPGTITIDFLLPHGKQHFLHPHARGDNAATISLSHTVHSQTTESKSVLVATSTVAASARF
jgi:hypothetical protein